MSRRTSRLLPNVNEMQMSRIAEWRDASCRQTWREVQDAQKYKTQIA